MPWCLQITAYIPFPFPHAQITSLFVVVVVALMPILMLEYVNNDYFGFFLNLLTVSCFTGVHEVARELEKPFQNVPNDAPLNNMQAQYNESLMQMFAGYHPDAVSVWGVWLKNRRIRPADPAPAFECRWSPNFKKTLSDPYQNIENDSPCLSDTSSNT